MKRFLLSILILIGSLNVLLAQKKINWSETQPLTWSDFTTLRDNGRGYAASVYWELSFSMEWQGDKASYEVDCFTLRDKSWVKRGRENPKLLAHERLHFDIAELYARKIREAFSHLSPRTGGDPNRIFDRYMKECTRLQDRYDSETDHGVIENAQKDWEERIARQLRKMQNWAV